MKNTENKSYVLPRIIFSLIYLSLSFLFILIKIKTMFYIEIKPNSFNIDRFYWCVSCSLFGFGILALHLRDHQKNPCPSYIIYYPFLLLMMASLVFSVLHIFNQTSGFVFYYLSFSVCFILSFFCR